MTEKSQKNTDVVLADVRGTQLEPYGQRDVVRELVSRLMLFHPAAREVGEVGMLAAAQLAVLIGASPLPGLNEIHIWKDKRGAIHVVPGINYDRRRSSELGGVLWDIEPRPMTDTERELYIVGDGELGAICRGARYESVRRLMGDGISINDAVKLLSITGTGTVLKTERAKNGRPLVWTAMKRAESDALRKMFPNLEQVEDTVEFVQHTLHQLGASRPPSDATPEEMKAVGHALYGSDFNGFDVEGEIIDTDTDSAKELPQSDIKSQQRTNGEREWPPRPWDAATLRERAQHELTFPAPNVLNVEGQRRLCMMSLSKITLNNDQKRRSVIAYLFKKKSSKDLTIGERAFLIDWVGLDDEDQVNGYAIDELERVVKARAEEMGQQRMDLPEGEA